jgi:hypothetical protein
MPQQSGQETERLRELEDGASAQLERLRGLRAPELARKNEDIKSMISYYNHLTDMVEERRMRIHTFSLQLLAISAAIFAVLISGTAWITPADFAFWPLVDSLVVLILASLVSGVVYELQSGFTYCFLKLEKYGNQWKWFYYGSDEILKISTRPIFATRAPSRTSVPYLAGLRNFVAKYCDEDLQSEVADNIQQLYLVQVHNYYKNRFYLQLTEVWKWALAAVIIIVIVASVIRIIQWPIQGVL